MGNAQLLKRLDTVQSSLQKNSKIVITGTTELVNVIGDLAGVVPLKEEIREKKAERRKQREESREKRVRA